MTIRHFITGYDSGINWEEWAIKLYGDGKLIVAAEKLRSNAHVHFHGDSTLTQKEWEKQFNLFKANHPIKKAPGGANLRPTKESKKPVDENGYQYVAKEKHQLYMQGVSPEELASLHKASNEHVEKMKNGMKEHIHGIHYEGAPAEVLRKLAHDCGFYLRVEKVNSRPQFVNDVYNVMMSHPEATDEWATYIVDRRMGLK